MAYEVFKRLNDVDVNITEYAAHKSWVVTGSGDQNVTVYEGLYLTGSLNTTTDPSHSDGTYKRSVFDSTNHLYYRNSDDPYNTFGCNRTDRETRKISDRITVVSVPQKIYGEGIKKESVVITDNSSGSKVIYDDSHGNLYDSGIDTTNYPSDVNLVGHWSFNDAYDKTTKVISTTTKNHAIAGNDLKVNRVRFQDGVYGTEIKFTGVADSYGRVENYRDINFFKDEDFSISFHLTVPPSQSNTDNTYNSIIEKNGKTFDARLGTDKEVNASFPYSFRIYNDTAGADNGKLLFTRYDGINTLEMKSSAINDGQPHHIAVTRMNSSMSLYVDSYESASVPDTMTSHTHNESDLWLGAIGSNTGSCVSCSLDELRFYNTGLTSAQVTASDNYPSLTNRIGNVFYEHGIMAITNPSASYRHVLLDDPTNNWELNFKGTQTIYEYEFLCTVGENQFNGSNNRSLRVNDEMDQEEAKGFASHSTFSPYVTSIGLYDDYGRLLAVGKLGQPVKNDPDVPITFAVRIDL